MVLFATLDRMNSSDPEVYDGSTTPVQAAVPPRTGRPAAVPVIVLTGYLGSGKTSVLNHLLRHPSARVGVIVNDFGELNVDAGLISGQVNEPVAISGGCICCLTDTGGLEDALRTMAAPKLRLDAIVVEASGFAEPLTVARMISRWGRSKFRLGGVIDVIDACEHFSTVDSGDNPPVRYAVATLVLVNKLDLVPSSEREDRLERIRARVHSRNPRALVVGTVLGRIDPHLLFDAERSDPVIQAKGNGQASASEGRDGWHQEELPLHDLFMEAYEERDAEILANLDTTGLDSHIHAHSVTVEMPRAVSAAAVMDFLEDLPAGAYRAKGVITVPTGRGTQSFVVQAVGPNVFAAPASPAEVAGIAPAGGASGASGCDTSGASGCGTSGAAASVTPGQSSAGSALVVIGADLDEEACRQAVSRALREVPADGSADGIERIRTLIRLHS